MTDADLIREAFHRSFDEGTQTGLFETHNGQTGYISPGGQYFDPICEAAWRWFQSGVAFAREERSGQLERANDQINHERTVLRAALDELQGRFNAVEQERDEAVAISDMAESHCKTLADERDRLRGALARIANFDPWELRDFATGVARAALASPTATEKET